MLDVMIAQDTGYVAADAERDFRRLRRQRRWSGLASKLRLTAGTCTQLMSFAEVTVGLGATAQHDLGLQAVDLDTIVGSVGKVGDFDCGFRPGRTVNERRWLGIARALRSGESLPPVTLYRVAGRHFVQDGHHRVSASRAVGRQSLDAFVVEVLTVSS
jgi:hypothetical protein